MMQGITGKRRGLYKTWFFYRLVILLKSEFKDFALIDERGKRMWTNNSIELKGRNGRKINNKYYKQENGSNILTVIIAGFAYTIESPILFYSKHVPFNAGSDVLTIDFEYSRNDNFLNKKEKEQDEWFYEEVNAIAEYIKESAYKEYHLIGKSLGTTTLLELLKDEEIEKMTKKVVWLTPGVMHEQIYEYIEKAKMKSLVVYGTADPYTTDKEIEKIKKNMNIEIMRIENADHGLESSDMKESIYILKDYIEKLEDFIRL